MFVGAGTLLNVVAVLIGGSLGVLLGQRLPQRVQDVVTDGLGLLTLAIGVLNILAVSEPALSRAVGDGWPLIVVLGGVLIGGIIGASLHLERQLANLGDWLRRVGLSTNDNDERRQRARRFRRTGPAAFHRWLRDSLARLLRGTSDDLRKFGRRTG